MATSKRTAALVPPDLTKYAAWGNHAQTAFDEGFYPQTSWFNNGTVFSSGYHQAFKDVIIPSQPNKRGDVAFIGYPNKTFDIVIRDKAGNIAHTINKGVSPDFVQDYITNNASTVAQRNMRILKTAQHVDVASK